MTGQADISDISITDLVRTYYPKIKVLTNSKAFKFHIPFDDLINEVNTNLARACDKNQFKGETERDFFAWLNCCINNSAITIKRVQTRNRDRYTSIDTDDSLIYNIGFSVNQDCLSLKNLLKDVLNWVTETYSTPKKIIYKTVFDLLFLEQATYEEISEKLGININSVKTLIRKIRKDVNNNFLSQYKDVFID